MDIENHYITYPEYHRLNKNFTEWLYDAAKRTGADLTYSSPIDGQLPLAEYRRLAVAIVTNGVMVPSDASDDLARMISIRKEVMSTVRALLPTDKATRASFATLESPLVVLRAVREMLDQETRIQNIIEALELLSSTELAETLLKEKPAKITVTGAQRKKAKKQQAKLADAVVSEEEAYRELLFAWLCFFKDFNDLRAYVRHTWILYDARELPLTHASLLTNTAFDLLRKNCVVHLGAMPTLGTGQPASNYVCAWLFDELGTHLPGPADSASYTATNHRLRDWTSCRTSWFLYRRRADLKPHTAIFAYVQPGAGQAKQNAEVEQYMRHSPWDDADALAACDDYWMRELYDELHHLTQFHWSLPASDCVTARWLDIDYARDGFEAIPLDLTLGFQLLVDVRHVLRGRIESGFEDMKKVGDEMVGNVQAYFQCTRGVEERDKNRHIPLELAALKFVQDIKKYIKEDYLAKSLQHHIKRFGLKPPPGQELAYVPYLLLRNHPLLGGMQVYRIQMSWWDFQIMFAGYFREVLHAAHLYNAMAIRGGLAKWRDMECLFATQGETKFFQGPRPVTTAQAVRQFALIKDVKLERGSSKTPTVHAPFWGHHGDEESETRAQPSEKSLSNLLGPCDGEQARMWVAGVDQHTMTGPQVLEITKRALESEEEALRWDHIGMIARCQRILDAVHEACLESAEILKRGKQTNRLFGQTNETGIID